MIVDSSSLLEQVVDDVILSGFLSAGQRCSALRLVYVQEEIAAPFRKMLMGAMAELTVGQPCALSTDIGPVIHNSAREELEKHLQEIQQVGKILYQAPLSEAHQKGSFMPPTLVELSSGAQLTKEAFGPIVHMVPYRSQDLSKVIEEINNSGFGLTFGIHSRIDHKVQKIARQIRAGNIYVNRGMTGAVVGTQPFGGEGLSGTGPKAGGPNYLKRFVVERTYTENTMASGGNPSLLSLPS